jgi:uncharacterized protein (TIGR03437 family)
MRLRCSLLALKILLLIGAMNCFSPLSTARVRLQDGRLWSGEKQFRVRGIGYSSAMSSLRKCLYARDLPLIAATGANTVRTYTLLPEGDTEFLSVLESAGLYWLADFSLDPFYDPSQTLGVKKEQILEAFREYAARLRGQPRLIGYIFGNDVTEDYNRKFAGSKSDFYALLQDVSSILSEIEPEETPLLGTAVGDLEKVRDSVPGLSLWAWNAPPGRSFGGLLEEIQQNATKPVLVSEYGVGSFGDEDEQEQAETGASLTMEIQAAPHLLGGVYTGFGNVFRAMVTERQDVDSLSPRKVFYSLAALWNGNFPPSWGIEGLPDIAKVENAASGADSVSPGALVRVTGTGLSDVESIASGDWPLHSGTVCLCIGASPAPLGYLSPESLTAQIPWTAQPGDEKAILFRGGVAGNTLVTHVQKYSPGIFPGAVVRAGTNCLVSPENGVRSGELLEVYATGLGTAGAPEVEAAINKMPATVLYAGLLPGFVGLNQVNLRVDPTTPPSPAASLELEVDGIFSNPYPLSVAAQTEMAGIVLSSPDTEILLQAGAEGRVVQLHVEGKDGYCGPVLFQAENLPDGVTFRVPVAFTGETIPLEVRAGPNAAAVEGHMFSLIGRATGTASGSLAMRLTVLPSRGDIPVRVISGGFKSRPLARFDWNGRTLFSTAGGGPGRGINVLPVNASTGVLSPVRTFDTWGDESASEALIGYLYGLPEGTIVLFAVADDASLLLSAEARDVIAGMFGSRFIQWISYQQSWAMIGRKGKGAPIAENASVQTQVVLNHVLTLPSP